MPVCLLTNDEEIVKDLEEKWNQANNLSVSGLLPKGFTMLLTDAGTPSGPVFLPGFCLDLVRGLGLEKRILLKIWQLSSRPYHLYW